MIPYRPRVPPDQMLRRTPRLPPSPEGGTGGVPATFLLRPPGKSPKSPPAFLPEKGGSLESIIGVWRSLVARFVRDEEAVGSNPATPTIGLLSA